MRVLLYLAIALLFSGCFSSYPMNLTKEEYEKLSLNKRVELRKEQERLNTKIYLQRLKNQKAKEQQEYKLSLKEQENLKELYKSSNSKAIVFIQNGELFGNKEYFIIPFEIQKFEVKKINYYDKNARYIKGSFWVSFQESGLYLAIDPKPSHKNLNSYVSYTNKDFFRNLNKTKPAIIPFSHKWYKTKIYKISFKNNYKEAKNIEVRILLKNRY